MKLENKRIFISDLPETATPDELENAIKNYGNVTSVEIKERKELGLKNNSLFFSYINVEIDDKNLQQCFKDFSYGKWFGQHVTLQIARESFLDRLKKEREQNSASSKEINVNTSTVQQLARNANLTNGLKKQLIGKRECAATESESSSVEDEKEDVSKPHREYNVDNLKTNTLKINDEENNHYDANESLDLVIKNNKGKVIDRNKLKIESVGKTPILIIDKSKKKTVVNSSEANLKRLQSLGNLKKAHKTQKSVIQQALSNIDSNSKKKIVFHDTKNVAKDSVQINNKSTRSLFDDDPQEDDFEPNFEIKEQFQGKKGQKLLELQTRYKNDTRFALDARFLDEGDQEENVNPAENNEEMSLEEEKKKEYEILGHVLGKNVLPKSQQKAELGSQKKVMLRFDPTHPEHSKFELKNELKKVKKKRKRENSETVLLNEKKQGEKEVPDVSKEVFYKVTEDLKDSLKEKQEFSLLSMFGKTYDEKEQDQEQSSQQITGSTNKFINEKNPFRYDSSDDEDQTDDIPHKQDLQQTETSTPLNKTRTLNRNTIWSEPFFFADDDYRLQEGVDFVEKISTKEDGDFTILRRNLKEIVKAKVRNNQRKNRPFKKKLGGSRKKKVLKIKKALKR